MVLKAITEDQALCRNLSRLQLAMIWVSIRSPDLLNEQNPVPTVNPVDFSRSLQ